MAGGRAPWLDNPSSRPARAPCVRPSMLQITFWFVYSVVLFFGGVTLGQTSMFRSIGLKSADGSKGAKKSPLHIKPKQRAVDGLHPVQHDVSRDTAVAPDGQAEHDHGEPGSANAGLAVMESNHEHGEPTDGIPGIADLANIGGDDRALIGLSTEPPGGPGETYAAPLPAGFYMPDDWKSVQRIIGWPKLSVQRPTDAELVDTAVVTMATGDESARHALALLQSMRDTGTRIPMMHVMLFRGGSGSRDCRDDASRTSRGRNHIACDGPDTTMVEVVSQVYLDAFERLGAVLTLADPIQNTPYIQDIPGGRGVSWGMALNKLTVFGLTQYRKVIWVDSDVFVLHNIDHLLLEPDFTAAFTNDCCNRNADCKMSGGMWVFHPSDARQKRINRMLDRPVPGTAGEAWLFGDMQVVLHAFARIDKGVSDFKEWPMSRDLRQGIVPGVRVLPAYVNMTDDILSDELLSGGRRGKILPPPGLLPGEQVVADAAAEALAAGRGSVDGAGWHMLDPRYDGLVGNCECLPERDLGPAYFSVHFTCLPVTPPVHKPGRYENEEEFFDHVRTRMKGCMRFYFLKWYDAFVRAVGRRMPEPYYTGPTLRIHDPASDAICDKKRQDAYDAAVAAERIRNGLAL